MAVLAFGTDLVGGELCEVSVFVFFFFLLLAISLSLNPAFIKPQ